MARAPKLAAAKSLQVLGLKGESGVGGLSSFSWTNISKGGGKNHFKREKKEKGECYN